MEDPRTDEHLMLSYGEGNAEAFAVLYGRWKRQIYRYVAHQCENGTADEIFQDIWLSVVNARQQYHVTAKFSTWLFTLAHNRLVDHWRKTGRTPVQETMLSPDDEGETWLDMAPAPESLRPDRLAERQEVARHVVLAIEALPDVQREAFLLAEEGMALEEIARTTGVGRETVKSRLRYAVAKLRAELRKWR